MTGSPTNFRVEALAEGAWRRLRDIRLAALEADPTVFLSDHATEQAYLEPRWREEFSRGDWYVMYESGQDVGLVGATREPDLPPHECDLEYLWVAPDSGGPAAPRCCSVRSWTSSAIPGCAPSGFGS